MTNPICVKVWEDTIAPCGAEMKKNGVSRGCQSWRCPKCGTTQSRLKQDNPGRPRKFKDKQESDKHHNALKSAKRIQAKSKLTEDKTND